MKGRAVETTAFSFPSVSVMNYFGLIFVNSTELYFQVSMWLLAVGVGMVFGKTIIHGILLSRFLRLKMFRADQVNFSTILTYRTTSFRALSFRLVRLPE